LDSDWSLVERVKNYSIINIDKIGLDAFHYVN
jgi:hypothetical protein